MRTPRNALHKTWFLKAIYQTLGHMSAQMDQRLILFYDGGEVFSFPFRTVNAEMQVLPQYLKTVPRKV